MLMLGINLNIKRLLVGENWLKTIRAPDPEEEEAESREKPSLCDDAFFLSQVANQESRFTYPRMLLLAFIDWLRQHFANQEVKEPRLSESEQVR